MTTTQRTPISVTAETPGEFVREAFAAIFDRHDVDAVRPYWNEQSVNHFLTLGLDARGPDQLAAFFEGLIAAIPDIDMQIESVVEAERRAVVQWRMRGTFSGAPFQGIEPTGDPIELRGCDVFQFTEDGMLDNNTIYYDGAEFARQIGMLPKRDSAADRGMLAAFNAGRRLRRRLRR